MVDFDAILESFHDLWIALDERITLERAFEVFSALAGSFAPSQLAGRTRGRILRDLLLSEDLGDDRVQFDGNLWRSGAVAIGTPDLGAKTVWLLAHLDAVSYAIQGRRGKEYWLLPLCLHRIEEGTRDGAAVFFRSDSQRLEVVARGEVITRDGGEIYFKTDADELPPGARIVFDVPTQLDRDSLILQGDIDNAAGCTAIYLALVTLASLGGRGKRPPPGALAVFPDEEEGVVSSGNQAFSRGSARLFNRAPAPAVPDLVIVCDVQGGSREEDAAPAAVMGEGAAFAEVSSLGKGISVPPTLYGFQHDLAAFLKAKGIRLRENKGHYLSRSDDVSAILYTPNVSLMGYVGTNRHLSRGLPQASLRDLVDLARTLVVYCLIAQNPEWRARYLAGPEPLVR